MSKVLRRSPPKGAQAFSHYIRSSRGDAIYDSNPLIMGNSIQTVALALDDTIQLTPNSSRTFDILGNDRDLTDGDLTITHLNGTAVTPGQTITLGTGERICLNADGTVTVFSDGDITTSTMNYTIVDSSGNTDVGFVTIRTISAVTRDGIVQGTAGNDVIQVGYASDPDGDRVDNGDTLGVGGTTGQGDYVMAGAGNDSVIANAGNDVVDAGTGNDTAYGDAGNDSLIGGGNTDLLYGGDGNDTLSGGTGSDSLFGDDDADRFDMSDDHQGDTIYGGEGGVDQDLIAFGNGVSTNGINVTFTGAEAGNYAFAGSASGTTGTFSQIEVIIGTGFNDQINATANTAAGTYSGQAGNDTITGGTAADTVYGSTGHDQVRGGSGNDSIFGDAGNDTLQGDAGADTLIGGADADILFGGQGDAIFGGESVTTGADNDILVLNRADVESIIFGGGNNEAGTVIFIAASGGGTLVFSEVEHIVFDGPVDGTTGDDVMGIGFADVNGDQIDGSDGDADTILGNGGNDTIAAGAGADLIFGGVGDDQAFGEGGNDTLNGDAGNDSLSGGLGDNLLSGGAGSDRLDGDSGNDTLQGGLGDDRFVLTDASGNDLLTGGEGGEVTGDLLDASIITGDAMLDLSADDATNPEDGTLTTGGATITFSEIERFTLGSGNDQVIGSSGADWVDAGAGDDILNFANIENVVACFTPGAMILTDQGEVAVENLHPGDRVLTRDNGFQTIRWTGRRDLSLAELIADPRFNPVCIPAGALGAGLPERDMVVSPQHRMLLTGTLAELMFGEHEVLVPARHLVGWAGITQRQTRGISYIHILFDQHEIVRADGAWSESFQPGGQMLDGLDGVQREEILALFPELAGGEPFPCARLTLKAREAQALLAA